eukprot:s714_g22.t1
MAMAAPAPCPAPVLRPQHAAILEGPVKRQPASAAASRPSVLAGAAAVAASSARAAKREARRQHQRRSGRRVAMAEAKISEELKVGPLKLKRGVLPNGMRYVLLRHLVPQGRCEAHLEFHVGSVDEQEDDQRGMAHMLEHICFLGSEKRQQLQSSGLGMTSNACTDFNHTVYYVSIGSEHVQEGLQVLSDVGKQDAMKAANEKLLKHLCGKGDFLRSKRRCLVVHETFFCLANCAGCQEFHAKGRERKVKDIWVEIFEAETWR